MSTKIHVGLSPGFIRAACLSEGQRTDMKVFPQLWETGDWKGVQRAIADKGYDFYAVRSLMRKAPIQPVIPRKKGAVCPGLPPELKELYKTRFAIEHFFGKMKENKRLTLRFDKLDHTFFSFLALSCLKTLDLLC